MKLKILLLVAVAFGLIKPFRTPITHKIVPLPSKATTVPFEAYWDAQGWDQEGSTFWKAKEVPVHKSV